jgi:cytochrome P450
MMVTISRDADELPQGIQLTPIDEAFRADPYAILKSLREVAPVHEDRELVRIFYTRHDDVKNLLHDKEFYTEPNKANPGTFAREILGGGCHLCLGAHLARIEAQEAILGLLHRYPNLKHSDRGFVHHSIPSFRGMSEFWVQDVTVAVHS